MKTKTAHITISGPPGSGKTVLSRIIACALHDHGMTGLLTDEGETWRISDVCPLSKRLPSFQVKITTEQTAP